MDSAVFSRLISGNSTHVSGVVGSKSAVYGCNNYIEIKKWEHLHVEEEGVDTFNLSSCVVVFKPTVNTF